MFRRAILGMIGISLVLSAIATADQKNRRKKNESKQEREAAARARQAQATIQAAQKQIAAARRVLAAAEASGKDATLQLDAAMMKLTEASGDFRDAQSTSRQLARDLAEIEQEILDEHKDDSAFVKATQDLETARTKLNEQQDDPAARARLESAAADLSRVRRALFEADADWKEASEALALARKEETQAEAKTRASGAGRIEAGATIRDSTEAAAAARAAIARAEAAIKAAERQAKNDLPPTKAKKSAKNKSKN